MSEPELHIDRMLVAHTIRPTGFGEFGVYAAQHIASGAPVVVYGGYVTPGPDFRQLPNDRQRHSLQIDDDLFLVGRQEPAAADLINHSCAPSLGFRGEITLVAIRDIDPGDELSFDYAMCDSSPYDEFECECGVDACRGKVTAEDWMRRDLQDRYPGSFSAYLQRRIDQLRGG